MKDCLKETPAGPVGKKAPRCIFWGWLIWIKDNWGPYGTMGERGAHPPYLIVERRFVVAIIVSRFGISRSSASS